MRVIGGSGQGLPGLRELPEPWWPHDCTISLVIPYYNYARYIGDAVSSIARCLPEERQILQVVGVDNGSDPTEGRIFAEQLRGLAPHVMDCKHIRLERNGPLGEARNVGVAAACGDFVCWLDPDDEVLPGRFKHCLAAAVGGLGQVIVHANAWLRSPHMVTYADCGGPADFGRLIEGCCVYCQSAMVPRWMYMALGGMTSLPLAEDYELWLRAAALGVRFVHVPAPVYIVRVHAEQKTAADANSDKWGDTHTEIRANALRLRSSGRSVIGDGASPECARVRVQLNNALPACPSLDGARVVWEAWRNGVMQGDLVTGSCEQGAAEFDITPFGFRKELQ
jgi:hypothetical protein